MLQTIMAETAINHHVKLFSINQSCGQKKNPPQTIASQSLGLSAVCPAYI